MVRVGGQFWRKTHPATTQSIAPPLKRGIRNHIEIVEWTCAIPLLRGVEGCVAAEIAFRRLAGEDSPVIAALDTLSSPSAERGICMV